MNTDFQKATSSTRVAELQAELHHLLELAEFQQRQIDELFHQLVERSVSSRLKSRAASHSTSTRASVGYSKKVSKKEATARISLSAAAIFSTSPLATAMQSSTLSVSKVVRSRTSVPQDFVSPKLLPQHLWPSR